mmetsp:Transcript_4710/g.16424  ORF Transcript_4710/g.16424 Transcript_4710/m.16424 type:complete len:309 (+) Transcript_4710:667-1593(+)
MTPMDLGSSTGAAMQVLRYSRSSAICVVTSPFSHVVFLLPARPAICFTRLGSTGAKASSPSATTNCPVNFSSVEKIVLLMLRFSPIPMASDATSTSNPLSLSLNSAACAFRLSGGSAPYTTQHLSFVLASISCFSSKMDLRLNATTQSPLSTLLRSPPSDSSDTTSDVMRSYLRTSNSSPRECATSRTVSTIEGSPHRCTSLAGMPYSALVHAHPRAPSAAICISSITATSRSVCTSSISTVHATCVAKGTSRFSCPVTRLQYVPLLLVRSYTSIARSLSGPQYTPRFACSSAWSAWYVLPLLVGPAW